jgi:putative membrane protein
MKNAIFLVLGIATLFLMQACHQKKGKNYNQQATKIDQQGLNFIRMAAEGGLAEIKASGIALTKTNNQRIIAFAKMMVSDHTQAGNELKKIKTDNNVTEKDSVSADHQKIIGDLENLPGRAFDKAYMQMMMDDHQQAVSLFSTATTNGEPAIKNFAKKTLPTIQMHLDSANTILASLNSKPGKSNKKSKAH